MEGRSFSHYEVLERLGGGGMGVVYKALDTKLNRHVALKFLPHELTRDDGARTRFIQEAQAASALDHPNICTIHEIDSTDDGQMFIAMTFYDGETLKKRIDRGPLPVDEAIDIAQQIATGLTKAHSAGIVHRDIKPANVMVTRDGFVKIVDFGIAKLVGVTGLTQTGSTLGTVSYMAPEQVAGEDADPQSDVWALGVLLYQMLTGQLPFRGETQWVVMNSITNAEPPPLSSVRSDTPVEVEDAVMRALRKRRDQRTASTDELRRHLEAFQAAPVPAVPAANAWQAFTKPGFAVPVIGVVLALGFWAAISARRGADERWAREEGIPEVARLIDEADYTAAYVVAEEVERHIPNDPVLADLWPIMSRTGSIVTDPPGADVFMKAYGADDRWTALGQTPIEDLRLPNALLELRIEKAGFRTRTLALRSARVLNPGRPLSMAAEATLPSEMVLVEGGSDDIRITGFNANEALHLDAFLIDRFETANRDFQEFVDAGGYEKREFWSGLNFVRDGQQLEWEEAMASFVDSTGHAGPATWELGSYPEGLGDHPVTGVSWYEAVAYARFRGKVLPTIYHWARAALTGNPGTLIVPRSNFNGEGPAPVGVHRGMGPFGTYDTAGNVREWCLNAAGDRRWVLGGSWTDPDYMFSQPYSLDPFDRAATNGFRLMRAGGAAEIRESLTASVEMRSVDLRTAEPVSDEVFEAFERQYAYPEAPLNASIEATDSNNEDWVRQEVAIDLSYTTERLPVYIFLPKNFEPPHQTVIFMGGVGNFNTQRSSDDIQPGFVDFIVRTGRALVWPVYKGSFQRWDGFLDLSGEAYLDAFTEHMIHWREDLGRTLDYLGTREDVDSDRLAYVGFSFGASTALPPAALEDRFDAMVLISGALTYRSLEPEADVLNFVSRVTAPVLMLNGNYDHLLPRETLQLPMYQLFGSAADSKRYASVDAGHGVLPRGFRIRETLRWLDEYLGPVN